jgi:hypothetical protein
MLRSLAFSPQDGPGRIPYKGTAVALTDLVAGHVDLSFIQFSAVHELHQGGKARVLAIAADQRVILFQSKPFNTAAPSRAQATSSSRARA